MGETERVGKNEGDREGEKGIEYQREIDREGYIWRETDRDRERVRF